MASPESACRARLRSRRSRGPSKSIACAVNTNQCRVRSQADMDDGDETRRSNKHDKPSKAKQRCDLSHANA